MKKKINFVINITAAIGLAALTIPGSAPAQQPGIKRTELQRYDLSVPAREIIQVRIDFACGSKFGKHSHPGEEIIYVLEGSIRYKVEGKPSVILRAGEVLFIPAGTIHAAENAGTTNASELATYIVEKGKQLVMLVKLISGQINAIKSIHHKKIKQWKQSHKYPA
jgi:quercetin dioxygenase-like cupin family protein